uniref:merlin-like n=1 Tax=Styela clava TaxID=7725 RepID=UPI0019398154|nr:merlin-like [Styela clava]
MPFPLFKKKKSINIRVSTLDADLEFTVSNQVKAQVVFDLICRTIGLRETWYFGLAFHDVKKRFTWIKLDKKLLNHAIPKPVNGDKLELKFLAKFYPESMEDELIQEVTRHLFFLQIQHLILSEDLYCPPEASVLLASFAVQAKYGDYDPEIHAPGFVEIQELLPKRVIDQFQMSKTMWEEKITSWYTEHRGLTRDEAELEYLKIAQDLEMCGVSYFSIKNRKGTSLWLGINAVSVSVYEKENQLHPIVSFQWSELSDMLFNDNKFTIKQNPSSRSATLRRTQSTSAEESSPADMIDMNKNDFIFFTDEPGINKLILELCRGNHDLFMQRRKVDSMEIQQMKSQAQEEKARKQMERARLLREKDEREKILMEKEELERKLKEMQDESKAALDALSRSEETAELLAEKAKVAEEEAMLLKRKANHSEQEMQRVKTEFAKTQEANIQLQQKLQNYDLMTHQLREESRSKSSEADNLRDELRKAKQAQADAKEKLSQIANSSHTSTQESNGTTYMYTAGGPLMTSTPAPGTHTHNGSNSNSTQITSQHLSLIQSVTVAPLNTTANGSPPAYSSGNGGGATAPFTTAPPIDNGVNVTATPAIQGGQNYMQQLTQEIEKERVEYQAKSRHIEQQLAALKSEIEDLKVDEKMTTFDHLHTESSLKGGSKYSTLNKSQEATPQQRVQLYDGL